VAGRMRVARCNELGLNCTLHTLACRTKAPPPQVSSSWGSEGSQKESTAEDEWGLLGEGLLLCRPGAELHAAHVGPQEETTTRKVSSGRKNEGG
jgi:hypothetical protein